MAIRIESLVLVLYKLSNAFSFRSYSVSVKLLNQSLTTSFSSMLFPLRFPPPNPTICLIHQWWNEQPVDFLPPILDFSSSVATIDWSDSSSSWIILPPSLKMDVQFLNLIHHISINIGYLFVNLHSSDFCSIQKAYCTTKLALDGIGVNLAHFLKSHI